MRENTYWPDLCLIQVATREEAAAIDPKAEGIDLTPLLEPAGQQRACAEGLPCRRPGYRDHLQPDRQGAHTRCSTPRSRRWRSGYGEQVGYSNLVESLLGHSLDKGARFTDWARRPLDKRQIDYAIGDVTHLAELFPQDARAAEARPAAATGSTRRWSGSPTRPTLHSTTRRRLEAAQAAQPQPGGARPAEGARRLARDRGAVEEPAARPDHEGRDAGRRSPATRPRPRRTSARCAACRRPGRATISARG